MDATIVLPLTAAPDRALRALQALATLTGEPAHEVVIVDDGSVGLEPVLALVEGDVQVVRLAQRCGLAAAARAGAQRGSGDVVVLLREDVEVRPGWLAELLRTLERPGVALAASAHEGADVPAVASHAVALRRSDLEAIGSFPAAPDDFAVAALCAAAASVGTIATAPGSLVAPLPARAPVAPGGCPELTIVVPTLDAAGDRVRRCVAALQAATDVAHEIVVVDNGAPAQGFTAPVNAGLRAGRGDYLVVCNDDVEVLPGWWAPLRAALDAGAAVAFPLTIDGAMRADFAAWCFALGRSTLEQHEVAPGEFLDPDLVVWYQDTDLLQRLRLAGRPPRLVTESRIRHGLSETVGTADPVLRAWIDAQILRDKAAFEAKHGTAVAGAAR